MKATRSTGTHNDSSAGFSAPPPGGAPGTFRSRACSPARAPSPGLRHYSISAFSILLLFLNLAGNTPEAGTGFGFALSIHEQRTENIVTPGDDRAVPMEFETDMLLFGRMAVHGEQPPGGIVTFNDSIRFSTTRPFPFESFMSRNSFIFHAEGKPAVVSTGGESPYDTMLACVFDGPALEIANPPEKFDSAVMSEDLPGVRSPAIRNLKPDCGSGGYARMNLPVSLGFFFVRPPAPQDEAGDMQWRELKTLPSFSGLGFNPDLAIPLRIVALDSGRLTAVFSADTTFEDVRQTLPNGETIDILAYKIHIGGTLFVAYPGGTPRGGEARIEEEISYLRPRVSMVAATKSCSSVLRLKTY